MDTQKKDTILESTEWLNSIYEYDPKAGGQRRFCHRCNGSAICWQHHIDRRRNSDRVVWICHECHDWIHRNPAKANKEGYYNNLTNIDMAEKKRKGGCKHMTYYSPQDNKYKCQFCGKLFAEPQEIKPKKKKS